ncbi:MAG: SpoIIE family protein phosphatase [Bryobacteraceae bacterium]
MTSADANLLLAVSPSNRTIEGRARSSRAGRPRILISDDQHDILTALSLLLKLNNYATETVDSPQDALEAAHRAKFDLILMDLNYSRDTTSGREGLDLLSRLRGSGLTSPIVVMTAWGNVELAVEAMRLGANDFVQKPWDNQRLLVTLEKQLASAESTERRQRQTQSEMDIARNVQQKLLPQTFQALTNLEYSALCLPAREVGGDYYDFFDLGENRIAGLLADVSGKGVAAAMLMANLQASFRTQLDAGFKEATELLTTINRLFYASTPVEQYVTLVYFEYENHSRRLRYVNCGHLAPALLRQNGELERLDATCTVLGLFPNFACESREIELKERDVVAIFTDGVSEFEDQNGEEFGEDRFLALVESARSLTPAAALRHISERLTTERNGNDQFDDQTVVLLKAR